jgi:hypothetical protein
MLSIMNEARVLDMSYLFCQDFPEIELGGGL